MESRHKSRHKKHHARRSAQNKRAPLGIYCDDTEIQTHSDQDVPDAVLPFDLWKSINQSLDIASRAAFAKVSKGAYALSSVADNQHGFYNDALRQRRMQLQQLLRMAVSGFFNQYHVANMLWNDTSLLFEKGKVTDDACGFKLTRDGDKVVFQQTEPVTYEGTLYQIMLRVGDLEMCQMLREIVSIEMPDALQKLDEQYHEVFPKGIKAHFKEQTKTTFDFSDIAAAIEKASHEELRAVLDEEYDPLNNPLCQALDEFRAKFDRQSLTDKCFNPNHLWQAMKMLKAKYNDQSGENKNANAWRKDIFWCQVHGYVQRYLSLCYKQAFSTGLFNLTRIKPAPDPLVRNEPIYSKERCTTFMFSALDLLGDSETDKDYCLGDEDYCLGLHFGVNSTIAYRDIADPNHFYAGQACRYPGRFCEDVFRYYVKHNKHPAYQDIAPENVGIMSYLKRMKR